MKLSNHWILPTLNGLPYSHKPPLLFWLINLMWGMFGTAVWTARIVSLCTAIAVFLLTGKLAKDLYPDRPYIARIAPLLALASPFYMVYGGMIMFDFLLYAGILMSMIALWRAGHDRNWRNWILFGLAMGFAVLAKGPVILVHTLGPALLAPLWLPRGLYSKPAWYGRVAIGILVATAVGLAWAIPAAIIGGPEFAHMIFWGQFRDAMVALGLELFSQSPADSVSAIKYPKGVTDKAFRNGLKSKHNVHVAGGQGSMEGEIFRVNHMGYSDAYDALAVVAAIEHVLRECGHPVELGRGVTAAQKALAELF